MNNTIIFGGSGFIGTHLSKFLLQSGFAEKVYVVDCRPPRFEDERLIYLPYDITQPFDGGAVKFDIVYNLAAVHTTPGHSQKEYFKTNIRGAEHICDFAARRKIKRLVFASSISPYEASESLKTEDTLPQPMSAYGSSKLAAEYIHQCWLAGNPERKLTIVRPGVVFGPGEGGNFVRLYDSLRKHYFFYPGRRDTKKACIYVKDLVRAMYEMSRSEERFQLYNMCYPKPHLIRAIVKEISAVTKVNSHYMIVPAFVLKVLGHIARAIGLSRSIGIDPERVKKLMVSTNVSGEKLAASPYALRFSLHEALEDWWEECEHKGLY
jgi:GlcNAc-P-P-Und epimerase